MPKLEDLKPLIAPILTKSGLTADHVERLFNESESLSDDIKNELSTKASSLITKQAAIADQEIRNNVLKQTFEGAEEKLKSSLQELKHVRLGDDVIESAFAKKHFTDKFLHVLTALDKPAETPTDVISKSEYEALQHKYGSLKEKHEKGGKAWEDQINQYRNKYEESLSLLEKERQEGQKKIQQIESIYTNNDLLSHIKGKIEGTKWYIEASEQKVLNEARNRAQFIRKEDGSLVVRNKNNPDLPIFFDEDMSKEVTPEKFIISIANEYDMLNKAGGGKVGTPRLPKDSVYSSSNGNGNEPDYKGTAKKAVTSNRDQFKQMGLI